MRIALSFGAVLFLACGGDDASTSGNGGASGSGGSADASSAGTAGQSGAGNAGASGATGRGGSGGSGTLDSGGGADAGGDRGGAGNGGAINDGASGSGGAFDSGRDSMDASSAPEGASGAGGATTDGATADGASGASGAGTGVDVVIDVGDEAAADGVTTADALPEAGANCDASADAGDDKRVFVSSALYTGALGGLTGADTKCQTLADAAGLCGTFKAWLSDDTGDAATRLTHATGNYVRTDGQIVAAGWSGLVSGTLQQPINRTETNGAAPVGTVKCGGSPVVPVWTGSTKAGVTVMNGSCSNWTSSGTAPAGIFGNADQTNSAWTAMCQIAAVCQSTAAIYCVEQ